MNDMHLKPKASVIISVYKDIVALNAILAGLARQSEQQFEIIVTEDGNSDDVKKYINNQRVTNKPLIHLSQEDNGFRKTKAVNRAIAAANADYVIFIDGDCIPHRHFVKRHLQNAERNRICTGRRVYLGPLISRIIRRLPGIMPLLENRFAYFLLALPLHLDHIRSYEVGFPSWLLHHFAQRRHLGIMGCNFSCHRADMYKINGYNEELPGAGGEDDDLEWRFNGLGMVTKNIKFQAAVYHLYHPVRRQQFNENIAIMQRNREKKAYICELGLSQYNT